MLQYRLYWPQKIVYMSKNPTPTNIKLLQKSHLLQVTFDDGVSYSLPCEYLRVFSPSAEVRGHGGQEPKLISGKKRVNIIGIDPIGNYAVKLIFDDGHQSGLYSWETLYQLGSQYETNWQQYLNRLTKANLSREPEVDTHG